MGITWTDIIQVGFALQDSTRSIVEYINTIEAGVGAKYYIKDSLHVGFGGQYRVICTVNNPLVGFGLFITAAIPNRFIHLVSRYWLNKTNDMFVNNTFS